MAAANDSTYHAVGLMAKWNVEQVNFDIHKTIEQMCSYIHGRIVFAIMQNDYALCNSCLLYRLLRTREGQSGHCRES